MQLLVSYHLSLPFVLSLLQLYHPLCEVGTTVRRGGCNEDLKKILIKLIIFLAVLGLYCCSFISVVYLAVPGLNCYMWDIQSSLWHEGYLVEACELLVAACGI